MTLILFLLCLVLAEVAAAKWDDCARMNTLTEI